MRTRRSLLLAATAIVISSCTSCPFEGAQKGKVHHAVFVWLKKPGDATDRLKLITAARDLKRDIKEVETLLIGHMLPSPRPIVDSTYDVGFVMRFANKQAMDSYEQNPIHQKAVKEVLMPMVKKIQVYDFVAE